MALNIKHSLIQRWLIKNEIKGRDEVERIKSASVEHQVVENLIAFRMSNDKSE